MSHLSPHLNQTITLETIYTAAPVDINGDPSYNTGVSYAARIERRIKKVITQAGEEAVSNTLIILDGSVSLDEYCRDRITLPTTMGSKQPIILAIEDARGDDGANDHWEIST